MANGGIFAQSGMRIVAQAAKFHAVPLVCITGLYKLCPVYPNEEGILNELTSPGAVLRFEDRAGRGIGRSGNVDGDENNSSSSSSSSLSVIDGTSSLSSSSSSSSAVAAAAAESERARRELEEDALGTDLLEVVNPALDYIPPDLVNIFITNHSVIPSGESGAGGHQPSYIYRLLSEYYIWPGN